ncbi:MAG: alpha-L-fucosidase, partial [Bacteroidaceae bacterium]
MTISPNRTAAQQSDYQPSIENQKNRKEFQDNKFGIFLHWGIYSMLANGEWALNDNNLNYKEYAKLASGFYPSKFSAAQWVAAIKASGAKYICFTTRHHDGFSMFDTQFSDYNIV